VIKDMNIQANTLLDKTMWNKIFAIFSPQIFTINMINVITKTIALKF